MQVTLLATEGLLPPTSASPTLSASSPKTSSASTTLRTNPVKPDFSRLPGPFTILRQTIATKGLRGLWLGQSGTLLRETGGSSAWFTGFEVVSRAFMRRREVAEGLEKGSVTKADLKAWELCVAGGFAGMAYNGSFVSQSHGVDIDDCSADRIKRSVSSPLLPPFRDTSFYLPQSSSSPLIPSSLLSKRMPSSDPTLPMLPSSPPAKRSLPHAASKAFTLGKSFF